MLPRARRVHGISKRRSRKRPIVTSRRLYCGFVPVAGSGLSNNARPSENAEERIFHRVINSQFKLGNFRTVLFLAAHIRARFSHRLRTAGFAEITVSQSRGGAYFDFIHA